MMKQALQDTTLCCSVHTSDLSGSAQSMHAHIQAVGDVFRETRVILSEEGPLVERLTQSGIHCRVVPFVHRGLRRRSWGRCYWRDLRDVIASRARFVREASRMFRSAACLVHVHSSLCVHAMLAARYAGCPLVVHIREVRHRDFESWFREQMIRILADKIVCVSEAVRQQYGRALRRRATTLYNWVNIPDRDLRPVGPRIPPVLGFVGTLQPRKGIAEFLKLCAMLAQHKIAFSAQVFGRPLNPEIEQWCKAFVKEHQLESQVVWHGFCADPAEIYPQMDILVLPARHDPLPRAVMEGMAWGIPVIATRVDGIPEMVGNDEAGILVPREDVSALFEAVRTLLRDRNLWQQKRVAAQERARKLFGKDRYRQVMIEMYEEILARRQR